MVLNFVISLGCVEDVSGTDTIAQWNRVNCVVAAVRSKFGILFEDYDGIVNSVFMSNCTESTGSIPDILCVHNEQSVFNHLTRCILSSLISVAVNRNNFHEHH